MVRDKEVQMSRTEWQLLQRLTPARSCCIDLLVRTWGPEYRDDMGICGYGSTASGVR